jgi:hypothetical protein
VLTLQYYSEKSRYSKNETFITLKVTNRNETEIIFKRHTKHFNHSSYVLEL